MRIVDDCAKEENGLAQRRLEKLFSDFFLNICLFAAQ